MRTTRLVLIVLLTTILAVGAGCVGLVGWVWNATVVSTSDEVEFVNRLAVPRLAPSRMDADGRRVFYLRAGEGDHDFGGRAARTWGFNGAYLGPTLRAAHGERVVVNVRNDLAETTSVHWHGMHLPAAMDGGPHQPVRPGETWSPTWRIDQPAATLWYHPHPHGDTASHAYRGLAGLFLIDDPGALAAGLPDRYGVDDIPVIVQDKRFGRDGRLDEEPRMFSDVGILGDSVVVNGTLAPYLDVTTERVRLRLLNASNARAYEFGFADDRAFAMVASDGGLLPAPYQTRRIGLSPGERAEIVVSMRAGERVVLRSTPPALGLNALSRRFAGGADTLDILELRAARLAASPNLPERLGDVPRLDPEQAARRRTFRLTGRTINGRRMDMTRVDATVVKGTTEVWQVTNSDGTPHSFHVHDVQFQLAAVDGHRPPPELAGWKDTIYLKPEVRYEIVVPFTDYADLEVPYMFHCHVLYHEDRGMMGQFVVVEPGQGSRAPSLPHDHGHAMPE